jgi:hypothetical protein
MSMNEEPSPRIRPIWLIGGGAAVVVLGVCALISVAAAALLIWFSGSISSSNLKPTQAVVTNPTQAATAAAPTPLPALNATLPVTPTQNTTVRPPPDQAVRSYYQLVSQERYDLTWPQLTDTFKQKFNCCAPNYDYAGYVNWWNSVNVVDFGTVSTVSQDTNRAVVYAELYFVMNTGARSSMDSNPYFELTYDSVSGAWRINDKRAAP